MGLSDFRGGKRDGRALLVESFQAQLLERFPGTKLTEIGPMEFLIEIPGRTELRIYLENLYRQLSGLDPEEQEALRTRHFIALFESGSAYEAPLATTDLVPTIKDQSYLETVAQNAPLVTEHLAADLWIVYARDLPTRIVTVKPEQVTALGLDPTSLRRLAVENLARVLPPVERHGDGSWFVVTAGGDYTASLLLLDEVWAQLEDVVEGDLVVAVPVRDVLLVTGTGSAQGIAAVKAKAQELEQGGSYAVSQTLLRRKNSSWIALS